MKNKLHKHHKSKAALLFRDFSLTISGLFLIIALAAIPTYISASNISETKAVETANKVENKDSSSEALSEYHESKLD